MSLGNVHFFGQDARYRLRSGAVGHISWCDFIDFLLNAAGQQADIWSVQVAAAPTAGEVYTITGTNQAGTWSVSATVVAGDDPADVVSKLILAWNTHPFARGAAVPSLSGADTLLLTGQSAFHPFTVSTTHGELTTTQTQAQADSGAVPFGRALLRTGFDTDANCNTGDLVLAAGLTAQSLTLTFTGAIGAGDVLRAKLTVPGYPTVVASAGFDTDLDTTVALLATNINTRIDALIGADGAVTAASAAAGVFTLTSDLAGLAWSWEVDTGDSAVTWSVTADNSGDPRTDINRALWGVSGFSYDVEVDVTTQAQAAYEGGFGLCAVKRGGVIVERDASESLTYTGQALFVEVSADRNTSGRFYLAAGSNGDRIRIDPALIHAVYQEPSTSDLVGFQIDVRLPT